MELGEPLDASSIGVGGRSSTSGLTLVRRKWSGHDVPSSARACELLAGEELEHDVAVGEVADHAVVARGDGPQVRRQRGRLGPALGRRERAAVVDDRRRTARVAVGVDVGLRGAR